MFEIFTFILPFVEAKTADEWNSEGLRLGQAGKYEDSIKAYDEALKINPGYARSWNGKGAALRGLRRNDEAIKAYDEALKINPQDALTWNNKGYALIELGRNDEANRAFEEASKLQKSPGFEILFAVAGLVTIAQLLKKAIK